MSLTCRVPAAFALETTNQLDAALADSLLQRRAARKTLLDHAKEKQEQTENTTQHLRRLIYYLRQRPSAQEGFPGQMLSPK